METSPMETSLLPDDTKLPNDIVLQLRGKVRLFPEKSGVYRMYDKKGTICYMNINLFFLLHNNQHLI